MNGKLACRGVWVVAHVFESATSQRVGLVCLIYSLPQHSYQVGTRIGLTLFFGVGLFKEFVVIGHSSFFMACVEQVVNGFFWAGKPVTSNVKGPSHSTALGVSTLLIVM